MERTYSQRVLKAHTRCQVLNIGIKTLNFVVNNKIKSMVIIVFSDCWFFFLCVIRFPRHCLLYSRPPNGGLGL